MTFDRPHTLLAAYKTFARLLSGSLLTCLLTAALLLNVGAPTFNNRAAVNRQVSRLPDKRRANVL